MSIKITNTKSEPALTFDGFFLCSLKLDQEPVVDNEANPQYTLRIQYRTYAVDDTDTRHYSSNVKHIEIQDYYTEAIKKAMVGDMDLVGAMQAIERALAKIIEDQTDLGTAEVV